MQAATVLDAVLDADPGNIQALSGLASLYHEYIGDFPKAYALMARLEKADHSVPNRLNLAEASFTMANFSGCLDLLSTTRPEEMPVSLATTRQVLFFACQWGAGKQKAAMETAQALEKYAGTLTRPAWTTSGDRKYLAAAPEFQQGRTLWIKLFQALENGDGVSLLEAAHALTALDEPR